MKTCSASLVIREMPMEITRCNFPPTKMAIIKMKITSIGKDVEKLCTF